VEKSDNRNDRLETMDTRPKDLTGDLVYDAIKSLTPPECETLGGCIITNFTAGPKQARKVLLMYYKIKETGEVRTAAFNYKKVERVLRS
jgi:hypothetical protein